MRSHGQLWMGILFTQGSLKGFSRFLSLIVTLVAISMATNTVPADGLSLLPLLQKAFPSVTSYTIEKTIIQANAKGYICALDISSSSPGNDTDDATRNNTPSRVFVKQVIAADYVEAKKDWSDLRRTLCYARTEVRYYQKFLPLLQARGLDEAPAVYLAQANFDGWIPESELANAQEFVTHDNHRTLPDASERGGTIILQCVEPTSHFQDSPLSTHNLQQCLAAVAALHAAAWQDKPLLTQAADELSRASFHLSVRNPKELASLPETWERFCNNFDEPLQAAMMNEQDISMDEIRALGRQFAAAAVYISQQVTPEPHDPYATIIHGDYKAMNVFLPLHSDTDHAILVDYASCGVGLGMSDVAMHLTHAVEPQMLLEQEESLVRYYWTSLQSALEKRQGRSSGDSETNSIQYPWPVAWKHYRLAQLDYFRFVAARFWKSATPAAMDQKASNPNVVLANRSVPAAMIFVQRAHRFLKDLAKDDSELAKRIQTSFEPTAEVAKEDEL